MKDKSEKIHYEEKIVGGTFTFDIPIKIDFFAAQYKDEVRKTCEVILRDLEGSEAQEILVTLLKSRAKKIIDNLQ